MNKGVLEYIKKRIKASKRVLEYKLNDDIVFKFKPLSYEQKLKIIEMSKKTTIVDAKPRELEELINENNEYINLISECFTEDSGFSRLEEIAEYDSINGGKCGDYYEFFATLTDYSVVYSILGFLFEESGKIEEKK